MTSVTRDIRHSRANRCPVCGGCDQDVRGQSKRCTGYTNAEWCRCSREEYAGALEPDENLLFRHLLTGTCKCGIAHDGGSSSSHTTRNTERDEIESVYPYHDENGVLLYEVVRKTGKRFLQRKPDGAGGWEWKLNGTRRVPYHLLALVRADESRPIYIPEGEKDVENLEKAGALATCNPGGAGKWHFVAETAKTALQGRIVIVIADKDKVGRAHAEQVAASLREVCTSVTVVECPEPHHDVSDMLGAGLPLSALVPSASVAPVKPSKSPPKPLRVVEPAVAQAERKDERLAKLADRGLPVIQLGLDLMRVVDEARDALAARGGVYSRGGALARVVRNVSTVGVKRALGTPTIRELANPSILELLTVSATFAKWNNKTESFTKAMPTAAVVSALSCRGEWEGIQPLVGVLETPALRPDGTILATPGYDDTTGYLYLPGSTFPVVPEHPTMEDAREAADALFEVVCDFPFATPEHRSAWLAFLLTLFARPAIEGCCPLMAVDATTRGTGKGKLIDATAIIATGREATKTPLPEDDAEARKRITALIMEGDAMACLDNIEGTIKLSSLDSALTATVWKDRQLGATQMVEAPNRLVWCATGNNISLGGDTARRTLHIRLESPLENPEDREDFTHSDLLGWVRRERPRLVAAALTILRAYFSHLERGGPAPKVRPWGSFEDWSRIVVSPLVWQGLPDPQATRMGLEASDTTRNVLVQLLDGWARLDPTGRGLTAKDAVRALWPGGKAPDAPDGHDELREALEQLGRAPAGRPPTSAKVGFALRGYRRRIVGNRYLDGETVQSATRWRVVSAPKGI